MQISFVHRRSETPRQPAYRILALAPFDPGGEAGGAPPLPVDRRTFAEALERIAPEVTIDIANLLTPESGTWWLPLRLRALVDFTPEGLIRQIPELAWIDALRRAIRAVAAGEESPGTLQARLADYAGVSGLGETLDLCRQALAEPAPARPSTPASPAPARPADGDALDRLFDLVDTASPSPAPPAKSPARGVMAGVVSALAAKPGRRAIPALNGAAGRVADLLARQIQAILAHPRLAALEEAWRGLRFLLQGLAPDAGVEVLILATDRERVVADLQLALGRADAGGEALDLILVDLPFAADALDRERLAELARTAEGASRPLLVSLDAGFFAEASERPLAALRDPAQLLDGPGFVKWKALCEDESFRWVAGCFNDFVLRPPYRPEQAHSAGLAQAGAALESTLWGHAGWLVAHRIAQRCQGGGWPAPISGGADGEIANLDLIAPQDRGDGSAERPLRHRLAIGQCTDLGEAGILALCCADNRDSAWIVATPSLQRVPPLANRQATAARRRDVSLTAQLVRARVIRCLVAAMDSLPGPADASRAPALQQYLGELISDTGASASARVAWDGALTVAVEIGERVFPGLCVDLRLGTENVTGDE